MPLRNLAFLLLCSLVFTSHGYAAGAEAVVASSPMAIYSPTPISRQVTITSRLRFDPNAGTQRLLLASLSPTMEGSPPQIALTLTVQPGWLSPIVSLSLEGEAALFPQHLRTESRDTNHGKVNALLLSDNVTIKSGELEAVLSVDLDTGYTAVSLSSPNTGAYFQGQLYLNPTPGMRLYAGMAGSCEDCSQSGSQSIQLDKLSVDQGIRRMGLPLAFSRNTWVRLVSPDDTNPYAGDKVIYTQNDLVAVISGIEKGLPGEFCLVAVSSAGVEKEIWRGQIKSADERLLISGGTLPADRYEIRLEYLEPGYQVVVAKTEVELIAAKVDAVSGHGKEEWSVRFSPVEAVNPTKVTIDAGQVTGSISPLLMGANTIYHLEKDAYWRPDLLPAALRDIKIGFLRYPGGSITSTYHWQKPAGRTWNEDTWSPSFDGYYEDAANWLGFDEYMAIVAQTGATPLVGINISSGHKFNRVEDGIAEAQAFVKYAKEKGYNIKHWFIDNEPYLPQSYVTLTPEEYAGYINLYSEALRAIDPEIKIIINWRQQWEPAWETILTLAGRNIDYLDLHSYWSWGTVTFAKWAEAPLMRAVSLTYEDTIRLFKSAIKRHGLDIKVGFFEWNIGPAENATKYVSPYQVGIMNAETFMQFIRGGADAAAFWPVHYDGQWSARSMISRYGLDAGKLETTPVYDMFSLYSSVLGDKLVLSKSDQQRTLTFAALNKDGNRLTVYLLRKDTSYTQVSLNLGSFTKGAGLAGSEIEVLSFTAPNGDLTSENAWVRALPWRLSAEADSIELAVEPYSLTRVTVALK